MTMFSLRLSAAIKASGLSYQKLEDMTGISHSQIQRYATGVTSKISTERVNALAAALNVTVEYLHGIADDQHAYDTFSERLYALIVFTRIAPAVINEALDLDEDGVDRMLCGDYEPTAREMEILARLLETSVQCLLGETKEIITGIAPYSQPLRVPVLGRIPAGIPIEAIEDILDFEELPADIARGGKEYFGLRVCGDSMVPEYKNGDTLILLKTDSCENGDDCAVMIDGDDATFKRVRISDRGLTLMPLNPAYDPIPFTNDEVQALPVRIIGVVVEVRRRIRR